MLVKFVKLILTIPGLLKYFEIVIVVITEEPLKEIVNLMIKVLWIIIPTKFMELKQKMKPFIHKVHTVFCK